MKLLFVLALTCACTMSAVTLTVVNGDDDNVVNFKNTQPGYVPAIKAAMLGLQNSRPAIGENGVYISSEPALTSPNLGQSRIYVMAGLAGADVPTDRTLNPAAWNRIPTTWGTNFGFQWFDMTTTTSLSFMGAPAPVSGLATNEHGHRIVISLSGRGNPSGYYVRVSTSLTNIASAYFPISTNSVGDTPLQFSYTFVGIDYGEDGVLNSAWSAQLGKWVAGGDDTVYDGSQVSPVYPYQVHIDYWQRFGSSVILTGAGPSNFSDVMDQFATMPIPWLKAELITGDTTVASETVTAAVPSLNIMKYTPTMYRLLIVGGQYNFPYDLESATDLSGAPWVKMLGQTLFLGSQGQFDVTNALPQDYFRLKTRRTW